MLNINSSRGNLISEEPLDMTARPQISATASGKIDEQVDSMKSPSLVNLQLSSENKAMEQHHRIVAPNIKINSPEDAKEGDLSP